MNIQYFPLEKEDGWRYGDTLNLRIRLIPHLYLGTILGIKQKLSLNVLNFGQRYLQIPILK